MSNEQKNQFFIHADGGARGNPGPAGAGAVIRDSVGNAVGSVSKFLGKRTNNFAEYEAVILAFETLAPLVQKNQHHGTSVVVKMDSELVVKQMRGEYKVKHPVLKEQYARLIHAASTFGNVSFTHVPRAQNGDADALANEAMDRGA
jgi:ribonuclease HI